MLCTSVRVINSEKFSSIIHVFFSALFPAAPHFFGIPIMDMLTAFEIVSQFLDVLFFSFFKLIFLFAEDTFCCLWVSL